VNSTPELPQLTDDASACERACTLLAQGRPEEAEQEAERAARALETVGESWLLAEALTTRGAALARLSRADEARVSLLRAAEVAERAGHAEQAGRALLAAVEELGAHMPRREVCETYERAAALLSASQDLETLRRLSACARRVLDLLDERQLPEGWDDFSFRDAVLRYESGIIERALKDAGGAVSRAAQLLGMKHHNNLVSIINTRHRELLTDRKPIVARRRSIIRKRRRRAPKPDEEGAR
jgi:Bacterial regulatory protein, Fis family